MSSSNLVSRVVGLVARSSPTPQSNTPANNSLSGLLTTLITVGLVFLIWMTVFMIVRVKFPRRYSPRTFVGTLTESRRTPSLGNSLVGWIGNFFAIPDSYVLTHSTLDGYLFLRFLKISVVICLVGCAITWPILFPVNATGGGGNTQLNLLTMANVKNNYYRYLAHVGCAYLFFGFIMFMITRETIYYINLRQAFLMSPMYASRISSKTVLFASVPEEYLDEVRLRKVLGDGVVRVWVPTDTKDLDDMVKERDKTVLKLEGAQTKLIKMANQARLKSMKKGGESTAIADEENGSASGRWVAQKNRPTHRLKPLIGQKVDTIDWCRAELPAMISKCEAEQLKHRSLTDVNRLNSVFVEFTSIIEAQSAYQSLTHHQVLHMAPRFTGITPGEIIWKNLRIKWWERVLRKIATNTFVTAMIIFWAIPVAVVGSISNINYLISVLPWLKFINKCPKVILGLITGLLPSVMLAVLMALVPIILRLMAKLGGAATKSQIELSVQNTYFAFQIIQVFLVATLASAASSSVGAIIKNPASVTTLLSTKLPLASNFYISYIILQGLGVAAGTLVGLAGLVIGMVLGKVLDKTPRKIYKRWNSLAGIGWGTLFPIYTNLLVIGICYACIAPLILGFGAIGLYLFYLAYRYNFLFVYDTDIDTKGAVYPRALQHLFWGMYVAQLCLIGLFAIKAGTGGGLASLILMIALFIFTILFHLSLNSAIKPLVDFMPKTLAAEEARLTALETGQANGNGLDDKSGVKEGATVVDDKAIDGPAPASALPAPHEKPSMIKKFLRPDIYTDYATMRRLVPRELSLVQYEQDIAQDAFLHPSITSSPGVIWIPRDEAGVSAQECRDTASVMPISDEGAYLNEKNKIIYDHEKAAPIYEEKIDY